jgi:hypothetical protein
VPEYTVSWEIQLTANTPREAAERALEIQRDSTSQATVFRIVDPENQVDWVIDLEEEHDDECITLCPFGEDEKCRIGHHCDLCNEEDNIG